MKKHYLGIVMGAAAVFLLAPFGAHAATLGVYPKSANVSAGSMITVSVNADSQGTAINNAEGTLVFPPDQFEVVSINKDSSLFNLWIQAPVYNGNGAISFNGGLPSPGYSGSNGIIFAVTLRAKASGNATISIANAAVRANDGLGTNVLTDTGAAQIAVAAPVQVAPVEPSVQLVPSQTAADAPLEQGSSLVVSSPTHPNERNWYQNNQPLMQWALPAGASAVQTVLSKSPAATPTVTYKPPTNEKQLDLLEDGIWYFNIRARVDGIWQPAVSYMLQIDTVPPLATAIIHYDAERRMISASGSATDSLSGIAGFALIVDDATTTKFAADAFARGAVDVAAHLSTGEHVVTLRALDKADNITDTKITISVVEQPDIFATLMGYLQGISLTQWLLAVMILISLASLATNLVLWKKLAEYREKALAPQKRRVSSSKKPKERVDD